MNPIKAITNLFRRKRRIRAPHSVSDIQHALNLAEQQLGLSYRGRPDFRVTYREGTVRTPYGWWGWPLGGRQVKGGDWSTAGRMTLAVRNGHVQITNPVTCNTVHECGHAILTSRGVAAHEHHKKMREAGFRW